jgi:hypothetical protein
MILGIAGGGLALILLFILMVGSGGGAKSPYRRKPPTRKGPEPTSGAPRFGGRKPVELTPSQRARITEANRIVNEARGALEKHFEKRGGSYTLKSEFHGKEDTVKAALAGAIDSMGRRAAILEELYNETGENFEEGKQAGRIMRDLRYCKRAVSK